MLWFERLFLGLLLLTGALLAGVALAVWWVRGSPVVREWFPAAVGGALAAVSLLILGGDQPLAALNGASSTTVAGITPCSSAAE